MLADIYDKIDSASWSILDTLETFRIPLAGLFEDHNIPPVIFPLAIIAIAALLFFALPGAGPGALAACGDSICGPGESIYNCPADCKEGIKRIIPPATLKVVLEGQLDCEATIQVYDALGYPARKEKGQQNEFVFTGLEEGKSFYATAVSPLARTEVSDTTRLESGENIITIPLTERFCLQDQPLGGLIIVVNDAFTGLNVEASVTFKLLTDAVITADVETQRVVSGTYTFDLPAGNWYFATVEKTGYHPFRSDAFYVEPGKTERLEVPLQPMVIPETGEPAVDALPPEDLVGQLVVCVNDDTGAPATSGEVSLFWSNGSPITIDTLGPGDLGCLSYTLPAGAVISASVSSPPEGCAASPPAATSIPLAGVTTLNLGVVCGEDKIAFVKISVRNSTWETITQDVAVTLWREGGNQVPGSGPGSSLAAGESGYTEEVAVPADTGIYAWARDVPFGQQEARSDTVFLPPGAHRTIDMTLSSTVQQQPHLFSFYGLNHPLEAEVGSEFEVSLDAVFFDYTQAAPEDAEVVFKILGEACPAVFGTKWTANCTVPAEPGQYQVVAEATVNGQTGWSDPSGFTAIQKLPGAGRVEIDPLEQTDRIPPLYLEYEILFDGEEVESLRDSRVLVESDRFGFSAEMGQLTYTAGLFRAVAEVPFRGEYRATIYVEVERNGSIYKYEHVHSFISAQSSAELEYSMITPKEIFAPGEGFSVGASASYKDQPLAGLDDLTLDLGWVSYGMKWDRDAEYYYVDLSLQEEGIYEMSVLLPDQEPSDPDRIYVIDPAGAQSESCPLDSDNPCVTRSEIRRCVADLFGGWSPHSEAEVVRCIEAAWGAPPKGSFACKSDRKGDANNNCIVDEEDIELAQKYLTTIVDPDERNGYRDCADMDLDGDVDDDDFLCLLKIAGDVWVGEKGSPDCSGPMRGGYCFDMSLDSPLKGDLVGTDLIIGDDDIETFERIVDIASRGPKPSQAMLDALDFDRDGRLTLMDKDCIDVFKGIGMRQWNVIEKQVIPDDCFDIYDMRCIDVKGDVTGDGEVSESDLMIMRLIIDGRANRDLVGLYCADINSDGTISQEDAVCVANLLEGDEAAFLGCIECEANIPEDAYGMEICGDGIDNDCNGLVDRTSVVAEEDWCKCIPSTPCEMKFDTDAGSMPGIEDGNYYVCRDISWDEVGYKWIHIDRLGCTQDLGCETQTCSGRTTICSSPPAQWYASGRLPSEVCGDNWDNDCSDGDMKCPSDGGGGGGCLSVYSGSQDGWTLDHLGYSFSILPIWEDYSFGLMSSIEPLDGILKVKFEEELPELTNVNAVRLYAVGHPEGTEAYPDSDGRIHTVRSFSPPAKCISDSGEDCTSAVSEKDGDYYLYDLSTHDVDDTPLDYLTLEFDKPAGVGSGKLLIHGRESGLITFVWGTILTMVGREDMDGFLDSMGADPFMGLYFQAWADRFGRIGIKDSAGERFEYLGYLGEHYWDRVLVPVALDENSDKAEITLTMAVGAFQIDSIQLDCSADEPIEVVELDMGSAVSLDGIDVTNLVSADDDSYFSTDIGGGAVLDFGDADTAAPEKSYIVAIKGHYTFDVPSGGLTPEEEDLIMRIFTDPVFMAQYMVPRYLTSAGI